MIRKLFAAGIFILVLAQQAQAHHTGGNSSSFNGVSHLMHRGVQRELKSRFYFQNDFSQLDNGVGQINTTTFAGEWAISNKFSLSFDLPFTYIATNFSSNDYGFGDISLGGVYSVFSNDDFFLQTSLNLTFPTGNENNGIGKGNAGSQAGIIAGYTYHEWLFYTSPQLSFEYTSPNDPMLISLAGARSPRFFKRMNASLSLLNQVYIRSDVFRNGSWKMYLCPELNISLGESEKLSLGLSGKIATIDQLSLKPTTIISNTNNSLFSDIKWGITSTLNYDF